MEQQRVPRGASAQSSEGIAVRWATERQVQRPSSGGAQQTTPPAPVHTAKRPGSGRVTHSVSPSPPTRPVVQLPARAAPWWPSPSPARTPSQTGLQPSRSRVSLPGEASWSFSGDPRTRPTPFSRSLVPSQRAKGSSVCAVKTHSHNQTTTGHLLFRKSIRPNVQVLYIEQLPIRRKVSVLET